MLKRFNLCTAFLVRIVATLWRRREFIRAFKQPTARINSRLHLSVCLAMSFCSVSYADSVTPNYQWGRGINLFSGQLNIGGYANSSYTQLSGQKNSLTLEDLSLFISASLSDSIRFFSEIELEDALSTKHTSNFNASLRVERLYLDYLATDEVTVRVGKWLTPFGRWNVVHAAPLVWTTTRPFITDELLFPAHSSGAMVSKKFNINEHNLDVSVYVDDSQHLDVRKDPINFQNAFGSRINLELTEQLQIGFSFLDFKQVDVHEARNHLFGVDFFWQHSGYEMQMEASYRHNASVQGDEKGLYIQGVAPLAKQVFAVSRYEYLEGAHQVNFTRLQSSTHAALAGLVWRPFVPLAIKAEYRFGSENQAVAPSGFFTSVAVLF